MSALTSQAITILSHVAQGRSPWDGWDLACINASPKAKAAAYSRRRDDIQACRAAGFLADDGQLTPVAFEALAAKAKAVEAFVG